MGLVAVVPHSGASGYGALVAARLGDPLLVHLCPRRNPFLAPPAPRSISGSRGQIRDAKPFRGDRRGKRLW
jgi:hypothetical protein